MHRNANNIGNPPSGNSGHHHHHYQFLLLLVEHRASMNSFQTLRSPAIPLTSFHDLPVFLITSSSFAAFSSPYLFFYIPEDSSPRQFSLLLLLLNCGRVTVIHRIKIFLLINPSVLHCHSAVVRQPYSSYYCKIYFGLQIYVGVLDTFSYHDVFPGKFIDYVSCQSLERM
jgi:hypothetical protein